MAHALRRSVETVEVEEPLGPDRLGSKDFARLATLIGDHVGIRLPPAKRLMVEGRLRRRVRGLGYRNISEYCRFLFDGNGLAGEFIHLVDAVTTNKTDFFRESEHFDLLEREIVPAIVARRGGNTQPLLKIWSAASSNGAEPYTIAMVLADIAARQRSFRFSILGTDISTEVLDHAVRAIYPAEMIEPVPPEMQRRYIMRGHTQSRRAEVRIAPELRRLVNFTRLNLMDESYPVDRDVDVIFLRNVLIYFDKPTQQRVVERLAGHLRPGGYLILGHSESMIGTSLRMRQLAPAVFERVQGAE